MRLLTVAVVSVIVVVVDSIDGALGLLGLPHHRQINQDSSPKAGWV